MEAAERAQRFDLDPRVPQSSRVYNAWLGGKDHYAADREVAARVMERRPQVVSAACANRLFLGRAVRYVAQRHGVTQFLDIGAGLPAPDNTHVVAQRIDPRARVVYVDSDPVVMAHARALLTSGPEGACDHVHADLRDTEYVLRSAARTLDFAPEAVGEAVDTYNKAVPTPVTARTHAQVTGLFAGLPLVAPGVVPVSEWRPDMIVRQVVDLYGGVARTPARRHWAQPRTPSRPSR